MCSVGDEQNRKSYIISRDTVQVQMYFVKIPMNMYFVKIPMDLYRFNCDVISGITINGIYSMSRFNVSYTCMNMSILVRPVTKYVGFIVHSADYIISFGPLRSVRIFRVLTFYV